MNWITSTEFAADSDFLWHVWWFPDRSLAPAYSKGFAALLGWNGNQLQQRYSVWSSLQLVEPSYCRIQVQPHVFQLLEIHNTNWKQDRQEALDRVLKLLRANIERNSLIPIHCREVWIYEIIRHWRQLDERKVACCKQQADQLSFLASQHFDHLRLVA